MEEDVWGVNISDFMDVASETLRVERGDEMFTVEGIRSHDKREVKFKPGTDVRPGDWLKADSGKRFYVCETDVRMFERRPFALLASYQTETEYEAAQFPPQPQAPTFNILGDSYGSVIGTQQNAQVLQPTFTFGDLEQEIDRRGGEDTEALQEMVSEIRATLESQDNLNRGWLLRWSELINRHQWITGAIAQLLLVYAVSGQVS